jgi:transcriptional regulator PpsR
LNPFKSPRKSIGDLDADIAAMAIGMAADIALIVDHGGVIRDIAFSNSDLEGRKFDQWIGHPWCETVTKESRDKVAELLAEASTGMATRWRQVNHPSPTGIDMPVRYVALRMNGERILVLGRDLSAMADLQQRLIDAQTTMEREYAKLRHAETRYRLLFQVASEAVVIVHVTSRKIVEVNPAAARLLNQDAKALSGRALKDLIAEGSHDDMNSLLASVGATGRAGAASVLISGQDLKLEMGASIFRQGNDAHFLLRFGRADAMAPVEAEDQVRASLLRAISEIPDGFVVTDMDQRIIAANSAFLDLAQLATEEQALGEPLSRWLGRSVDVNVISANLRKQGSLRQFATVINGEFGAREPIELSAVSVSGTDDACLGFAMRPVRSRIEVMGGDSTALPRDASQLTALVGRVTLKDLVRETTDVIERLCIETALKLTGDNRASAAEMLGMSRQSLYSKLRRYGFSDLDSPDD